MEVVEGHVMTITSKHEEAVSEDDTGMAITGLRSLSWRLGHWLIVAAWGSPLLFSIKSSFSDLSITFFKTWICIFNQKRIFHSNRSWWLQFNLSLVNLISADRSQSNFRLLRSLYLLILSWRRRIIEHILSHTLHGHSLLQTNRVRGITKIILCWRLFLGRIQFLKQA